MSSRTDSAGYSPEDLGILEAEPTEEDLATEPVEEASGEATEADTQEDGDGDETPPQQSAEEGEESPEEAYVEPGTSNVFEFMGKEYDTKEAAEQALSSWEGRIRAESERRQSADQRLEEYYRYVQDAHSKNEELYRQLQEAQKPESEKAEAEKKAKGFDETIDWEEVQSIRDLAVQKGYDPEVVTSRILAQKAGEYVKEQVDAVRAELSAPYPELKATDGEVADPLFTQNMYSAWQKLAQDNPQFGFSPEGVDYAYRLAREFHDSQAPPAPAPEIRETVKAPTKTTPARGAKGRFIESKNADAEAASEGTGAFDPTTEAAKPDELEAMMGRMSAIKTVKPGNEDLGIYE
jgi:hypothetical protein